MTLDDSMRDAWVAMRNKRRRDSDGPSDDGELPLFGGSGGGTSGGMDSMKDYVDARDAAVEARLMSKLDSVITRLDALKDTLPSKTTLEDNRKSVIHNIWGIGLALFVGVFGVLAFAGDRFDSGLSLSPQIATIQENQTAVDRRQDAQAKILDDKLDIIIKQTAKN